MFLNFHVFEMLFFVCVSKDNVCEEIFLNEIKNSQDKHISQQIRVRLTFYGLSATKIG